MSYRISWRDVFDSSHKLWRDIYECSDEVRKTGYKFFTFNGIIYHIEKDCSVATEWTIKDIG